MTVLERPFARTLALASLMFVATQVSAVPMGPDDARLLLSRTGFAATADSVKIWSQLSREQAVDRLLADSRTTPITPPPGWVSEFVPRRQFRDATDAEKKELQRRELTKSLELRAWWLQEMLLTPSPLTERMTLFWHNHFVSSQQKVKSPVLMYRQNVLLRRHALGRFSDLLHAVSKDPAMIFYLDNASNRRAQPNENFAREVMELFTLGEGHYSERDIKEAARAFTGWSIEPDTGTFKFRYFQHDDGVKTVLGRSGNFDGDDVLNILLAQPATAELITAKLWREFVSPEPDPAAVQRLASRFRDSGYDIKVVLRGLLTSPAFYAQENRASLIKSPVDLTVGTLELFQVETGELTPFAVLNAALGQNLFAPPNVKGWPGGESWINSTTLLARKQFLDRLFRAQEMRGDSQAMMAAFRGGGGGGIKNPAKLGEQMRGRFIEALSEIHFDEPRWTARLADDPRAITQLVLATQPVNAPDPKLRGMDLIRALTQDPAYQLK